MSETLTEPRPWRRAALILAGLGVFFYVTYGFSNWLASQRAQVGSIVFAWEYSIPFLAWTIIPYWSTNAFYAISVFICTTRRELETHARRLFTAQVIAVTCFILFPLRFSFEKPDTSGLTGFMFEALGSFDMPFNQAPSLHIALTIILWARLLRYLPGWAQHLLNVWFALVIVSVLTTFQHHFIDIPTGALLGWFANWLWPEQGVSPRAAWRWSSDPKRRALALRYALGALALAALALVIGGLGWLLFWPALSCLLVAANYAAIGSDGFQKLADGRMRTAAKWLFAPYLAAAWLNARLWTRHDRHPAEVADGVWIGPHPAVADMSRLKPAQVVDLCAELPNRPAHMTVRAMPALDLVTVPEDTARRAVHAIEHARASGPVLVCCALGYGRSAAAVASWLCATGRARDKAEAIALIRIARPRAVVAERDVTDVSLAAQAAT